MEKCIFCELPEDRIILRGEYCFAIRDAYPVSPGHTLIIPRRHVASFFDLSPEEWMETREMAQVLSRELREDDSSITGFNLGINAGEDAGQTVFHVHVHLIPRRSGDVPRPEGGVRWIFPDKACYRDR
jgi:diadenosine tetraphosphate (Ap4A) HIT family hydrolase